MKCGPLKKNCFPVLLQTETSLEIPTVVRLYLVFVLVKI